MFSGNLLELCVLLQRVQVRRGSLRELDLADIIHDASYLQQGTCKRGLGMKQGTLYLAPYPTKECSPNALQKRIIVCFLGAK